MFDLGQPWRIWHAIIMWNPHSVMFEVAWCVMLYTTVLALEFSPMLFERIGWKIAYHTVHRLTVPLVILGVLLSMLHQSSLGSLFLILPGKLYPLWYSPWLPIFFFISAVALGCAMTIFESFLSYRALRKAAGDRPAGAAWARSWACRWLSTSSSSSLTCGGAEFFTLVFRVDVRRTDVSA